MAEQPRKRLAACREWQHAEQEQNPCLAMPPTPARTQYTYRLPWPPSVNTAWRHSGKITYLTKPQREFRKQVHLESVRTNGGIRLTGRLAVALELIAPTKRKYDIDGRIKAVLDALQHAGIIADDEQVDHLDVRRLHIESPGCCDVSITELSDESE